MKKAIFRFYAELNDFLDKSTRFKPFEYKFLGNPSVKDVIETLGVPHTEVDLILVNSKNVDFNYNLKDGDFVSVYPVFESFDISGLKGGEALRNIKFIADVHLGKLARLLRILGFDTIYKNNLNDREIIEKSIAEKRVILTRDMGILKNGKVNRGYFVRSDKPRLQVKEVIRRFDLYSLISPFNRCPICNGELTEVDKKSILSAIPQKTRNHYNEFKACRSCGKIYWRGTHFKRIEDFIKEIMAEKA